MSENTDSRPAILIVDDDFVVRRLLEDELDFEYQYELATSRNEALKLLEAKEFSVVLADIHMEGATSLELISLISSKAPDTVVIMTGEERTIDTAIDALRAGAFDYITVPSDMENVRPSVKRAIRHYELIKEKRIYENRLAETLQRWRALEDTRAFIAHEFRHALTPLNAYAKMLGDALAHPEVDREKSLALTERIQKQTDTAFELVNQYLDYSRPLVPKFERTKINDLVEQSLEEFKAEFEDRQIVLRTHFTKNAIAELDKGMISQVLRNIFANAIQAMERNRSLDVATYVNDDGVAISIRDMGTGIKPEHLDHIFQLGFTTKSGAKGAGVGLALSKRIVEEAHRGSLAIRNNGGGQGATVLITIPTFQPEIGWLQDATREFGAAKDIIKETLKEHRTDLLARIELAKVYQVQKRYVEAEQVLQELIQLVPHNLQARTELAKVYQVQKRYPEVERALEELIYLDPHNVRARTELAKVYQVQRRFSDAERVFKELIRLDPHNLRARIGLARVFQSRKRYSDAEQVLKESIKLAPHSLQARTELAKVYQMQRRYSDAERVLDESIQLDPHNLQARTELAKVYQVQKRFDDAERVLRELIQLDPQRALNWLKSIKFKSVTLRLRRY